MFFKIELLLLLLIITYISCNDLEIKKQDIKNILKNKYKIDIDGSKIKICIQRNFESLVLIELLHDNEGLSIISDYEGFIQVRKHNLNCADIDTQLFNLKQKSEFQAQVANEIIAKYLPINSNVLNDYIIDKTSEIGKVVGKFMKINNKIDRLIDMKVECTSNIQDKEALKKQKDCGTRMIIF